MEFLYSKLWLVLNVFNALFMFLIMLNGSSKGALKDHVDAILGGLVIICLILMFVFVGWKGASVGFLLAFVFGAITMDAANRLRERCKTKQR